METCQIFNRDCLEKMKDLPDKSVDLIFCDLPYGQTSCKWDCKIDKYPYIYDNHNEVRCIINSISPEEMFLSIRPGLGEECPRWFLIC